MEKRVQFRQGLKTRVEKGNEDKRIIRGYPILFDEVTDRAGYFKEKVDRHALDDVDLSEVLLVVGHDFNNLLARAGVNMRLEVDDTGLWFEAELGDTEYDKTIYDRVRRGILDGMSFGFTIDALETDYDAEVDTIKRIGQLFEITLTPIPAYPQTVATAVERKAEHEKELQAEKDKEKIEELDKQLEAL